VAKDPVDLISEPDIVELAQALVRIPSQFIEGELVEHDEISRFLADHMRSIGLEVEVPEEVDGYPVVVGSTPKCGDGPVVGVIGHYSTVAIGDRSEWTQDPLGGELIDGKIYGRGTIDQKAGIAAVLNAAKALIDSGNELNGQLRLLMVPGEGCTEMAMEPIGKNQPDSIKCDVYVDCDGEPGNISLAHGGFIWFELTCKGHGGHSGALTADGTPPVNPITKLVSVLNHLQDGHWMTYERHRLFKPEFGRYTEDSIVDINVISGGSKVNIIPNIARAQVDIRMLPSQTVEGLRKELDATLQQLRDNDPDLDIDYEILAISKNNRETPPDHFVVKAIQDTMEEFDQDKPKLVGSIGGGRGTLSQFGPIIHFGAGAGAGVHAPDEYADVDGLVLGAKLHARLYSRLLT
jgi:succinyl-diaminopimelate desuccinylase